MFEVWFWGMILFIAFRVFYAGMNTKKLFYRVPHSWEGRGLQFEETLVLEYVLKTLIPAFSWPVIAPLIGLFMLGQRFSKKED